MIGMLQILTYLLAVYLVVKGVEVLQIALASPRENRGFIIVIGIFTLIGCIIAAVVLVVMQENQAMSIGKSMDNIIPK